MGCDSYPVRDVLEVIRKRDHIQGNVSTCVSFWRNFFFFHGLLHKNLKTMKKKSSTSWIFLSPATNSLLSRWAFSEVAFIPSISALSWLMHFPCSTFCRQNKCIEINFSWKEVFCLLFYEGFMNSVAEILAIYLPLLFSCQRKSVCLAWGKWCWRWSSSSTCSTSGMSFLMAMGAE